eukprot:TRINITY_DN34276_c0_g1_i8.p1 TRINITY_DN34276_c0_g1~~TRINITY_DN34276_c0_g1_i8.p1  ORF type:complete len:240 (-),score=71.60 TRINITY_DN34276_c0_g1_i8:9-728(-)
MNPRLVLGVLQKLEPLWPQVVAMGTFSKALAEVLERFHERLAEACEKALGGADYDKKVPALLDFAKDAERAAQALRVYAGPDAESLSAIPQVLAKMVVLEFLSRADKELSKDEGMNSAVLLQSFKDLALAWSTLKPEADAASLTDGDAASPSPGSRLSAARGKVRSRMLDSMKEASSAGNEKKKQVLLKFAADLDAACDSLLGKHTGSDGSDSVKNALEAQLAGSKADEASPSPPANTV